MPTIISNQSKLQLVSNRFGLQYLCQIINQFQIQMKPSSSHFESLNSFPTKPLDQDASVVLKCTLNMPESARCFNPREILYYVDNFSLFVVKYTSSFLPPTFDKQQNKRFLRIPLPSEKGSTSINKIQNVFMNPEDLILIGFSNTFSLYRLATGNFVYSFGLPNIQDQILCISPAIQINNNTSFLTVMTTNESYILRISYASQLNMQLFPLESPSLLKTIGSFFKKSPSQPKQNYCFTIKLIEEQRLLSLVVSDGVWRLYSYNLSSGRIYKQWENNLFPVQKFQILNMVAENPKPNQRQFINVYGLVKEADTITSLFRVKISLSDGRNIQNRVLVSDQKSNRTEFLLSPNKIYISVKNTHNRQSKLSIYNSNLMTIDKQILIQGQIVVGYDIIITEGEIYSITDTSSGSVYHHNSYYGEVRSVRSSNEDQEYYFREIQKASRPSGRLENVLKYEQLDYQFIRQEISQQLQSLQKQLNQLSKTSAKEAYQMCLEQIVFKHLQLIILSNMKKPQISKIIHGETQPYPITEFFRNTSYIQSVLKSLAQSNFWQFYVQLITNVVSLLSSYGGSENFYDAKESLARKLMPSILGCLNMKKHEHSSHDKTLLNKLLKLGLQLDNHHVGLYEWIFKTNDFKQYYEMCFKYMFDNGMIKVYVQTDYVTDKMIKDYVSHTQNPNFLGDLCQYYFQYVSTKRIRSLKLLIDLPEYTQKFYQICMLKYPQYAWILLLNMPVKNYELKETLENIYARNLSNQNMILNLQIDGVQNKVVGTKLNILKICEQLGVNNLSFEQFITFINGKTTEQFERTKKLAQKVGISLADTIRDAQVFSQ